MSEKFQENQYQLLEDFLIGYGGSARFSAIEIGSITFFLDWLVENYDVRRKSHVIE